MSKDQKVLDLILECTNKIMGLKRWADETESPTLNYNEVFALLYDLGYQIEKIAEIPEPKETDNDDFGLDRPICPHCNSKIYPVHYKGYYDQFDCWLCECENIPTPRKVTDRGQYA